MVDLLQYSMANNKQGASRSSVHSTKRISESEKVCDGTMSHEEVGMVP